MTKFAWNIREDFGTECAQGDGTGEGGGTNDTDAFLNAVEEVSNRRGVLLIPPAEPGHVYRVKESLKPANAIKIIGAGRQAVTIWAEDMAVGTPIIDLDYLPEQNKEDIEIRGFELRSNNQQPVGIRAKNASYLHIEDLKYHSLLDGVVYEGERTFSNTARRMAGYNMAGSTIKWQHFRGGGQFSFDTATVQGDIGIYQDDDSVVGSVEFRNLNAEGCRIFAGRFRGSLDVLSMSGRTEAGAGPYDFVFSPEADPRDPLKPHRQSGVSVSSMMFTSQSANTRAMIFGGGAGVVDGVTLSGNEAINSSTDVFAYMYGGVSSVVAAGNTLRHPNAQMFNSGATNVASSQYVPGLFARANRNGSGLVANIG